jgi:hypothetical protein
VISSDPSLATLHELSTIYGVEDLYDMIEVLAVNGHNRRAAMKKD